jgi:Tol biopolymer transport system component
VHCNQLWKIKSNSDSLTQLTTSGNFNNNAIWNSEGTKLIYRKAGAGSAPSLFLMIDETGGTIDTIPELRYISSWHWSSDDEIISCITANAMDEVVLGFYNINNREFSEMPPLDVPQYGYIMDTDWITEDISVWGTYQLIGTTDIITNESKEIAKGYQNRFYDNLAASPDGTSIVVEREDFFQIGDCDIETRRNLYIMNADGSNERKINIPE